jgi:hypothetical protein
MGTRQSALTDKLAVLEAERMILTIELRNDLLREAKKLLPRAIAQAKGKPARKRKDGTWSAAKPGSPGLLRLISRLAMRDVRIDRTPKP